MCLTPSLSLDFIKTGSRVVKASATLSGEIILGNLLTKIMEIVIENAGAERGLLLLQDRDAWTIESEGHVDGQRVSVGHSATTMKGDRTPVSLVEHVARTRETVLLDNAAGEGRFTQDPYIIEHRSRPGPATATS